MMESGESPSTEKDESALDLSSLLNNDALGPNWTSGKQPRPPKSNYREDSGGRRHRERTPRDGDGDRRRSGGGRAPDRRQGGRRRDQRPSRPYQPEYNVQLQPNGQAFNALIKAMRDSCRTFELFEIANLFLSKPDRFVAKLLPREGAPPELASFHISVPDGIGFESEDEAVGHVLANHIERFYDVEEIEVEPPKGTFNVVNRCSVTGTLLGPPNYHRYQHILQEHYSSRISGMSFERFTSRIETASEQEVIDEWVESMKKGFNYKTKDGNSEFKHLEEARRHLLMNHKNQVVKSSDMCRVDGKDLDKLPHNRIRRSIESVLESQNKFPLDFANHLRGRLRRANFTIYKRGGRGGVTFVCAVKRQYRTADSSFSESIQTLLQFIEDNQNVTAQQILSNDSSPEQSTKDEVPKDTEGNEVDSDTASPVELVGEKPNSATLGQDLRWLVQSGFVTEYSDGRLFAPPVRDEKAKVADSKPAEAPNSDESEKSDAAQLGTNDIADSVELDKTKAALEPEEPIESEALEPAEQSIPCEDPEADAQKDTEATTAEDTGQDSSAEETEVAVNDSETAEKNVAEEGSESMASDSESADIHVSKAEESVRQENSPPETTEPPESGG